jgi:hypothetical protein
MNGKGWLGLNGITPALVTMGFHSSGSLPTRDIWTAGWLPLTTSNRRVVGRLFRRSLVGGDCRRPSWRKVGAAGGAPIVPFEGRAGPPMASCFSNHLRMRSPGRGLKDLHFQAVANPAKFKDQKGARYDDSSRKRFHAASMKLRSRVGTPFSSVPSLRESSRGTV